MIDATEPSHEYAEALETSRAAYGEFQKFVKAYRAGSIGDDEFLAARKINDEATRDFDSAMAKEQAR